MGRIVAGAGSTKKAEILRTRYCVARMALLVAIVFSVLNCIFSFFGGVFYSAFSYTFPQAMIDNARFLTGKMYTLEEYEQMFGMTQADFLHPDFMFLDGGFALAAIALLVVCWVLSKKRGGWMIAATVLLGVDMLFEVYWYDIAIGYLAEYVMPGILLAIMIVGIVSFYRLEVMEWTAEVPVPAAVPAAGQGDEARPDSPVLHAIDYSLKSKILMIYDIQGYTVCYRKIGTIYELAIDKMVYDTVDAGRHRQPHELSARVDGHDIAVGTSTDSRMYICFDGNVVKKTMRYFT